MIKLYDTNYTCKSKNEALSYCGIGTGFPKGDFKCEVITEPKKIGLLKKEDGVFHCWYEYEGLDADKELVIADATLYFDTNKKRILVVRYGFKTYEINYSDLADYEMVVNSNERTYTVSNKNKALKGALLFGTVGAVVGSQDSQKVTETVEWADLIIRLRFKNQEPFEIITCNNKFEVGEELWRDVLDQSKIADEWFKGLVK